MKGKKYLFILVISALLLPAAITARAIQVYAGAGEDLANTGQLISTLQELTVALESADTQQAELTLASDIELQGELSVQSNKEIILHGDGHQITMATPNQADAGNPSRAMWHVQEGARLTLQDVTVSGGYNSRLVTVEAGASLAIEDGTKLTGGYASEVQDMKYAGQCIFNKGEVVMETAEISAANLGYYGTVYNAGTFRLGEGAVIRNVKSICGGAIYNEKGAQLLMEGGSIDSANGQTDCGAAVSNFGEFIMSGGRISGSKCQRSAVYNVGTFTMSGGAIQDNDNTYMITKNGGGGTVYNGKVTRDGQDFTGAFTMTGGGIEQNVAVTGGGIFQDGGTVTVDGSEAQIKGNTASYAITSSTNVSDFGNGGGVFVKSGTFELKSGSIEQNTAKYTLEGDRTQKACGNGGGVYLYSGTFAMTGGSLCGNLADGTNQDAASHACVGGGVCINGGNLAASLVVSGGVISGNEAKVAETSGVYVANTALGESASGYGQMFLSGAPQISDQVYLSAGAYLTASGPLGMETPVPLYFAQAYAGMAAVKYQEASGNEFLKESDLNCFRCVQEGKTLSLDPDQRMITIGKLDISQCTLQLGQTEYVYTGEEIRPSVTVTDGQGVSTQAFVVKYENNIQAGTGVVTVAGDGYVAEGSLSATFQIAPAPLTQADIQLTPESNLYTGQDVVPETALTFNGRTLIPYSEGGEAADYQVVYENNREITAQAPAKAIFTGMGNFTGTVEKEFYIGKAQTILGSASYEKTWEDPAFTLDTMLTNTEAGAGLTYASDNGAVIQVDSATGQATITGTGTAVITATAARTANYAAAVKQIHITVHKAAQTIDTPSSVTKQYGSGSILLDIKGLPQQGGALSFTSSKTSVAAVNGSGEVTPKGVGEAIITITAASTSHYEAATCKVTVAITPGTQEFSGKIAYNKVYKNKPFTLNLKALKERAALSYRSENPKIATVTPKTGKVAITGIGRVTIVVTAAATQNYAKGSRAITLTVKPQKTVLSSAKNTAKGAVTLKWKKTAKADGYQIQVASDKNFKKGVHYYVVSGGSKTKQVVASNLKKGKTYYMRVQAYKKVGTKALTGSFSKSKKVKIAK